MPCTSWEAGLIYRWHAIPLVERHLLCGSPLVEPFSILLERLWFVLAYVVEEVHA